MIKVIQEGGSVTFSAENVYELSVIDERLKQYRIGYTCCFGASGTITASMDQGTDPSAIDREMRLLDLINDYTSVGGEAI